jgi:hypothetical protein
VVASVRFAYSHIADQPASLMPRLPLSLRYALRSAEVIGLLDTGSAVNVLPYYIGQELGAVWEEQATPVTLAGSLGRFEARALIVYATQPRLPIADPVRLVFAWTQTNDAPVILGQVNFFMEFDVCFHRSQGMFEVRPKGRS